MTFTVSTAALNIIVPTNVSLGSAFEGNSLTSQTGNVSVSDLRAALAATWIASVATTAFTTGTGTGPETVQPGLVNYWSGGAVASSGTGTIVPGQPTAATAVSLNQPRTAFSKTSGSGDNTVTWNPTLVITIPSDAVGGLYQGTVTHSVG